MPNCSSTCKGKEFLYKKRKLHRKDIAPSFRKAKFKKDYVPNKIIKEHEHTVLRRHNNTHLKITKETLDVIRDAIFFYFLIKILKRNYGGSISGKMQATKFLLRHWVVTSYFLATVYDLEWNFLTDIYNKRIFVYKNSGHKHRV